MEKPKYKKTTINIPIEFVEKIEKDAEKDDRDFSKQIIYIIRKHYEIKENR